MRTRSRNEILYLPLRNTYDLIQLSPGSVGNHFRGGDGYDLNYFVNGISFMNRLNNQPQLFLPLALFNSINLYSGNGPFEFGIAQSGLFNHQTVRESEKFTGLIDCKTGGSGNSSPAINSDDMLT